MNRAKGLYVLDSEALDLAYGPDDRVRIADLIELVGLPQTRTSILQCPQLLQEVEVLMSGWGAPAMDEAFLGHAPKLRAVFYAGGSIASWMTDAAWARGVIVSSAYAANAVPVAEYALATILFSLKHGWSLARQTRERRMYPERNGAPGCFGSTIGLVSLGASARALRNLLRSFNLHVIAYDPFVTPDEAQALGVERVTLDDLFRRSDVVSLHAPLLGETIGMISGEHLASMKQGATFINTARGELVREAQMIEVLRRRPDLQAVLDVADREPPLPDSPLYTLPNVMLTPHIAGSVGSECRRMGRWMVEELQRYLSGDPLQWAITPALAARTSHRLVTHDRRDPAQPNGHCHVVTTVQMPKPASATVA